MLEHRDDTLAVPLATSKRNRDEERRKRNTSKNEVKKSERSQEMGKGSALLLEADNKTHY